MKITFENPDKINGLMTLTVEQEDYKENVEKQLKQLRKKANVPGFRPGMVPMGMIKKQYGMAAKMDEINKLVGEKMYGYIRENKSQMLGEPLPSSKQEPQDLEGDGPFTFIFDVAVAPEFKVTLDSADAVPYYKLKVDDALIDRQVDAYASRNGHYDKVEAFNPEERDMLKGDIRELDADGNTLEGGITVADAVLMPQYIKVDEQKDLFKEAKLGDIITFNPRKAYPDNDAEVSSLLKIDRDKVGEHTGDFSYQVTEISRYVKAAVDQELFDNVYGKDAVTDEAGFREKVAEELRTQLAMESDYRFLHDVRTYAENKVGELTFPEELLKRVMKENNKDKDDDFVEKNFAGSIRELKWHLIKEQLVEANKVQIADEDVKRVAVEDARAQFAQYGMTQVPEEYLENYADDMLKKKENVNAYVDRAVDVALMSALKNAVHLDEKEVTLDEFRALN